MVIAVKYFGMIAEKLGKSSEELLLSDKEQSLADFRKTVIAIYPVLEKMTFKIASNQQLLPEDTLIKGSVELALLPPFAGG